MGHLTRIEIEAGLEQILRSPKNKGIVKMIVARPCENERCVQEVGELNIEKGLIGDNWANDRDSNIDAQIAIINSRLISLLAGDAKRWPLAGDQLCLDLDLSDANLPPGTKLEIGSALLEITSLPHNGCRKFADRFGSEALKFVNSPIGKQLHLRGIYAKIIRSGIIREGDFVKKIIGRVR